MIAQLVIAFYFIVCVGIILFNCFTEIISRYRSCVLKRREQRYCEEYRQLFLENITENKKQEKRLVKELHSTSRLLTFSEALYKVENSMPEQFQQGIAPVSRLMEELIPVYKRKSDMEKACLAYVFAIFHMTKFQAKEIVFPFLFDLLGNKSLYCRENALRALYSSEDIHAVMQALTFLDANEQLLPHEKILADGLLSFDKKEELIPLLWEKMSEFHPRMQSLEYDRSFLAARILLDKINANMIISGAFGLFEKKTVIAVGGYDNSTMGEDMELVVRLHEFSRMNRKPYKIHFAQDAICWSQTPEKLSELCKQRKRWQRGLFQCMWGHRKMLANPRYGAVGLLSYLYFLLYELLSPFIELLGVLTMVLSVVMDMLNVKFMLVFLACYALYGILLTLTAYFSRIYTIDQKLSFRELILAIIACFFETTFLRFSLAFVRATAFVGYKKNKLNWGKLERKKMNRI